MDLAYLRELCEHWADDYDWRAARARPERALELALGRHPLHLGAGADGDRAATARLPVLLIHGWPGGLIEFCDLIPLLVGRRATT